MYMRDWLEPLDKFLSDFGISVPKRAGKISHNDAVGGLSYTLEIR